MDIPDFSDLMTSFPIVTVSALLIYFGWYLRGQSSKETGLAHKDFIDYLKSRGRRSGDE